MIVPSCHVSQNKQCQRWCDSALSCVFTWNTVILTARCHRFMHCSRVHAKLIVTSGWHASLSPTQLFAFSKKKKKKNWVQDAPPAHLGEENTFHLSYRFWFSMNIVDQTFSNDDEINEKQIKGFLPQTSGMDVFVFRSSLIMCPRSSSQLPVRIQHGPGRRSWAVSSIQMQLRSLKLSLSLWALGDPCTSGLRFVAIGTR